MTKVDTPKHMRKQIISPYCTNYYYNIIKSVAQKFKKQIRSYCTHIIVVGIKTIKNKDQKTVDRKKKFFEKHNVQNIIYFCDVRSKCHTSVVDLSTMSVITY